MSEEQLGFFARIGRAIKLFFMQRYVSRAIEIIEENPREVLHTIDNTVDGVKEVVSSTAKVTSNVAKVAISDNEAAVALHKEMANGAGSWLTNNARPIAFLISFGYLIAQTFDLVPPAEWPQLVVLGYMGMRTVDKLGQMFSAAGVLKNLIKR